jgi:cytochrome P450
MNPLAVTKARSRLRAAKRAVETLSACEDYDTFADTWYTFLVAAKSIYTVLEQGAKTSAQSRQWFGAKSTERRKDPLLQYLYQARDDDEHGVKPVVEHVSEVLALGIHKPGYSTSFRIDGTIGQGGTIQATSLDGKPVLVWYAAAHTRLIRVHGRDRKPYDPPHEVDPIRWTGIRVS